MRLVIRQTNQTCGPINLESFIFCSSIMEFKSFSIGSILGEEFGNEFVSFH